MTNDERNDVSKANTARKPMTPEERAERIRRALIPLVDLGPSIVDFIASEIKLAQEEALADFSHDANIVLSTSVDVAREESYAKGFADGFSEAREKAAKVCYCWQPTIEKCECPGHVLAKAIRALRSDSEGTAEGEK